MRCRRFWIDKQCALDQPHGGLVIAELLFRHAEKMQRVKMIGVLFQDLPIALLGLRQRPR